MSAERCPTPEALDAAFYARDGEYALHRADCARCAEAWRALEAFDALGARLPASAEPDPDRGATARAALVREPRPVRPRRIALAAAVVALVAGAWLWLRPAPAQRMASVYAHADAHWTHLGDRADEVVRLLEGRLTVNVEHLGPGERFRVVVGDAEVEVRGTAFDVQARADQLAGVRVISGVVAVRAGDEPEVVLTRGERWRPGPETPSAGHETRPSPQRAAPPGAAPADERAGSAADDAAEAEGDVRAEHQVRARRPVDRSAGGVDARRAPRDERTVDPDRRVEPPEGAAEEPPPAAADPLAPRDWDQAWARLQAGRFAEAAQAFEAYLAAAPGGPLAEDARYWAAVTRGRSGDRPATIAALERYLRHHPDAARAGEVKVMLGWQLLEADRPEEARGHFAAAVEDPSPRVRASARSGLLGIETRRARRLGHSSAGRDERPIP